MTNILHIDTSIQGEASVSRRISAAIVTRVVAEHPQAVVTYRDYAAAPLPHLTLPDFAQPHSEAALSEFEAADIVVIGAGMYNFGIPSQLKAWIDRLAVAGRTFRYSAAGPEGLAGGKRVYLALARGGFYGEGSPARAVEHAETYLRDVFAFIGLPDIEVITIDGTNGSDGRAAAIDVAERRVATLAA